MTTYSNPGAIADVVGTTGRIEATWGNAIRDRVINVFASTAARDAAITVPVEGMVCYVTADDAEYRYNGTAWTRFDIGWISYTPTVDQGGTLNITKTITYCKYRQQGRTVNVSMSLAMTGAGTANAVVLVSTPLTAAMAGLIVGSGYIYDASTNAIFGCISELSSTTKFDFVDTTIGTGARQGLTGAAFAVALASGDAIVFNACYETAT